MDVRNIESKHLQEWLESAVDKKIIELNVESLSGEIVYEYLLYSRKISRRNDGRLRDRDLNKYLHTLRGGWWCSGIDPLNNYQPMIWGCFKPDFPRKNPEKKDKRIKYEHPYKESTRALFLMVPEEIWIMVSSRHNIPISEEDRNNPRGFWHWVWKNCVPITITEGAKKAGALLSAGYAAISLPGIYSGYRSPKDENDKPIGKPYLIPELQMFCTLARKIYICFDRDEKQETQEKVNKAIYKTAKLLASGGSKVEIVQLPVGGGKGVDDFIAAQGREVFESIQQKARPLYKWDIDSYKALTYGAHIKLNKRFLGKLNIPKNTKLVAIKSAKNTGKTFSLAQEVAKAHARGQKVLVLTHRVELGKVLCDVFGIDYVSELKDSETGGVLGYGLCVDSMRKSTAANFNPNDWFNAVVIIDEADQVFWHLLNSSTQVKQHRVEILRNLKKLVQVVLNSPLGRIYLSSADLSDIDIKYVIALAQMDIEPFVILNEYRQDLGNCYLYEGKDPGNMVEALIEDIKQGGVPFICCSAQQEKSNWSTTTLENTLLKMFPDKKILRIDSESTWNPNHPAYNCISSLNHVLGLYDIVIVSSCVETGISIEITEHFTGVWCIAQGVQPENSIRQMLKRVRENVDRHLWVAKRGIEGCKVGNGSINLISLISSTKTATRANIQLLTLADYEENSFFELVDTQFQQESLKTWAAKACVINYGLNNYRETIVEGLDNEGYNIFSVSADGKAKITEVIKQVQEYHYSQHCNSVTNSYIQDDNEHKKSKEKRTKTTEERHAERKTELTKRYGVDVTPELVKRDDNGWYPQLRLHYYLTIGRPFLKSRDTNKAASKVIEGFGSLWLPDFNRGQLLPQIQLLEALGVKVFLEPGRQWRGVDSQVQYTANLAITNHFIIKNYLNVTITEDMPPIKIVNKLLEKIDCKLHYISRQGSRGDRHNVYEFIPPQDSRDEILSGWLESDKLKSKATQTMIRVS